MSKLLLVAAIAAIATPALGSCPAPEAETKGYILSNQDPYIFVTYLRNKDGMVETRSTKPHGQIKTVTSYYSHPLLVVKHVKGNEVLELQYANQHQDLNSLPKVGTWTSPVELLVNGKKSKTGTATLRYQRTRHISVGACRYKVWEIDDQLLLAGRTRIRLTKYYSPELRILLRATMRGENGATMDTTFDEIRSVDD